MIAPFFNRYFCGGLLSLVVGWMALANALPPSHWQYGEWITYHGVPLRWEADRLPQQTLLLVADPALTPQQLAWVEASLAQWQAALPPTTPLPWRWASEGETPTWTLHFVPQLNEASPNSEGFQRQRVAALTTPTLDAHGCLQGMTLRFSTRNAHGFPESPAVLERSVLHEFGHALGLLGHSPNWDDVLSEATPHYLGATIRLTLSEGDKATIRWLYSQPYQCFPPPPH